MLPRDSAFSDPTRHLPYPPEPRVETQLIKKADDDSVRIPRRDFERIVHDLRELALADGRFSAADRNAAEDLADELSSYFRG